MKQKRIKDQIVFYRESGKIIEIVGVLSEEELLTDPSLLEEEQKERIQKVIKELENDERRDGSI